MLTIMSMAIGTVMIGVLPTYAEIGIAAPVLLVIARLVQGFSAGGEWGGSTAFIVEWAPSDRRGWYGSFQQAVVANCLAHRRFECCAPVGQSDSFLAEQAADRVLEGDQLRLQGCASPQQPALSLRFWRFDPDRSVFVDAHQIGDAASIVAIVLVAKTGLQRRGRVPRIDADARDHSQPRLFGSKSALHIDY